MAKRDYYDILGIPKTASADEIKRAHRKLVRQYHPDVNKNNKGAEEKFKEVQEAYDVLSDEQKRKNYDQFGHAGVGGGVGGGGDPFEAFRRARGGNARGGWQPGPGGTVEDFGDFGNAADFGDIFDQIFGGGAARAARGNGGPRQRTRARAEAVTPDRGADIEHGVELEFAQAARGTTLPLMITRDGKPETIEIKVPPGVKDGSKIRIRGKGQHTAHGGEAGDLYIVTTVRPHAYYRRDNLDVLLDVPISLYEALLGTKVTVPTLDGEVTITIPPGTSSGAKLRVKGRGIARGEEKGDQLCVVKVVVPKNLSDDEKSLVEKLQSTKPVNARADVGW
jgi:DnaJ-class molecular chaperone